MQNYADQDEDQRSERPGGSRDNAAEDVEYEKGQEEVKEM